MAPRTTLARAYPAFLCLVPTPATTTIWWICLATGVASADLRAEPYLVRDINTEVPSAPLSGGGADFVEINGAVFFVAADAAHGSELWMTDGTPAGTMLLKDIRPGGQSGGSHLLTVVGETLFFLANDGTAGQELWVSDGTRSGTRMVKDIFPGWQPSRPYQLTNVGGTLFFIADDGVAGDELWTSDGTEEGTLLVKDILPGPGSSMYEYYDDPAFTAAGHVLFFIADDGVSGDELWKSDGTEAGTILVKDILPGPDGSLRHSYSASALAHASGILFFAAFQETTGVELWKSDGTAEGTVLVKDIRPGPEASMRDFYSPTALLPVNTGVFFVADDGLHGDQLWKSDGTGEGTLRISDIALAYHHSRPEMLTNADGTVFFNVDQGRDGSELWRSNGEADGTARISVFADMRWAILGELTVVEGIVFFSAADLDTGAELWMSDGTETGTTLVRDIWPGPESSGPFHLRNVNGKLFFSAYDPAVGREPWQSDGTEEGTKLVHDIRGDASSSALSGLHPLRGNLIFRATGTSMPPALWRSDGTQSGTVVVKDILPGYDRALAGGREFRPTAFNGQLFFAADDAYGTELWRTDGTGGGTVLVKDIIPGDGDSAPRLFLVSGGILYFSANFGGRNSPELWKTDGTEGGTVLVKEIYEGLGGSSPVSLAEANGEVFFVANDGIHGKELWKTDGTSEGTVLVRDMNPGPDGSYPSHLHGIGDTLLFRAVYDTKGVELWASDGTEAGTAPVKDINPGWDGSHPTPVWSDSDFALLVTNDGVHGTELWRSDGTSQGTYLVRDVYPGPTGAFYLWGPFHFGALNGIVLFRANDGIHGNELWRTDGTEIGTMLVADIEPGPGSSMPGDFAVSTPCGPLLFTAYDTEHGLEVWRTDGTPQGTWRLTDVAPGYEGANPNWLTVAGSQVYFTAHDAETGTELWALDLSEVVTLGDVDCDGCVGSLDHRGFVACLSGPLGAVPPECDPADVNRDESVDLRDAALIQRAYQGP